MDKVITVLTLIVGFIAVSFLLAWPVMMLWNTCLVPAINGVNQVDWIQAWGLTFLASAFFKNTCTSK